MQIAFFSWESLHSIAVGGIANHVTELAAALARKGQEVHVFTRMGNGQPYYQWIDGVHYHRCPFDLHPDFITEINNMCRSFICQLWQTEDYIGGFDLIHAHDWLTAKALAWAKDGRDKKGIFTIHSTEYGRCGNNNWGGRSAIIRDYEWEGAYRADRAITVSETLRQEVMQLYKTPAWKLRVIYNGVSANQLNGFINPEQIKAQYGIGPLDPMILFVGRVAYQKGPDILVEAIPSVLNFHRATKVVFVGDGDMRMGLENRCRSLGISHAVRFVGRKDGYALYDLYKACDAVCVPSRNEPFGIVILEAWSAGKPVIVTQNGGPQEIVWHNITGLKVYPSPDSIAWGLKTILSNFEHARWMGQKGRYAAETAFTWDAAADKTLAVYHEL